MKVAGRDKIAEAKGQGTAKRAGRYTPPKTKEGQFSAIVKLLEAILAQPPQVNVAAPEVVIPEQVPVKSWDFEVMRNKDGFITRVKAERVE